MAPLPSTRGRCTRRLCLLLLLDLSTATLAAVVPTSHSSSPGAPAPDRHGEVANDDVELLSSSSLFTGFFSVLGVDKQQQVTAGGSTVWRMDRLESIVRVACKMLFCVLMVLHQIRYAKRNHEAHPTMSSMTMAIRLVVVLSLGCVMLDFILSHWVFLLVTFVYLFS